MLKPGTEAPTFSVYDHNGNSINLKNINKVQVMHPITFLNSNLV